jgi:hypothetical protein
MTRAMQLHPNLHNISLTSFTVKTLQFDLVSDRSRLLLSECLPDRLDTPSLSTSSRFLIQHSKSPRHGCLVLKDNTATSCNIILPALSLLSRKEARNFRRWKERFRHLSLMAHYPTRTHGKPATVVFTSQSQDNGPMVSILSSASLDFAQLSHKTHYESPPLDAIRPTSSSSSTSLGVPPLSSSIPQSQPGHFRANTLAAVALVSVVLVGACVILGILIQRRRLVKKRLERASECNERGYGSRESSGQLSMESNLVHFPHGQTLSLSQRNHHITFQDP